METPKYETPRPICTEELHAVVLTPARFAASYHTHVAPLYRYFSQHTGNAADAEDLTAATINKALASLHSYAGRGTLAAWLFGIARHTLQDFQRQRGNILTLDAMVVARERWDDLHTHIRALPANQREALTLRYFGGLPIAVIAVLLDRSEGAVKLLIHRALTTLRTQYRQEEQQ